MLWHHRDSRLETGDNLATRLNHCVDTILPPVKLTAETSGRTPAEGRMLTVRMRGATCAAPAASGASFWKQGFLFGMTREPER